MTSFITATYIILKRQQVGGKALEREKINCWNKKCLAAKEMCAKTETKECGNLVKNVHIELSSNTNMQTR